MEDLVSFAGSPRRTHGCGELVPVGGGEVSRRLFSNKPPRWTPSSAKANDSIAGTGGGAVRGELRGEQERACAWCTARTSSSWRCPAGPRAQDMQDYQRVAALNSTTPAPAGRGAPWWWLPQPRPGHRRPRKPPLSSLHEDNARGWRVQAPRCSSLATGTILRGRSCHRAANLALTEENQAEFQEGGMGDGDG